MVGAGDDDASVQGNELTRGSQGRPAARCSAFQKTCLGRINGSC